jgi:hypothetical protein
VRGAERTAVRLVLRYRKVVGFQDVGPPCLTHDADATGGYVRTRPGHKWTSISVDAESVTSRYAVPTEAATIGTCERAIRASTEQSLNNSLQNSRITRFSPELPVRSLLAVEVQAARPPAIAGRCAIPDYGHGS